MMMDFPLDVSNTPSSVTCENECFDQTVLGILVERKSNVFCFHLVVMNSILIILLLFGRKRRSSIICVCWKDEEFAATSMMKI